MRKVGSSKSKDSPFSVCLAPSSVFSAAGAWSSRNVLMMINGRMVFILLANAPVDSTRTAPSASDT